MANLNQTQLTSESIDECGVETTQENVGFVDMEPAHHNVIDSNPDHTFHQPTTTNTELGTFLSRPVRLVSTSTAVGATLNTSLPVWEDFFSHPAVAKKIDNYYLLKCKLMVKVVVNASPFMYGKILVSYNPYPVDSQVPETTGTRLQSRSQRPHIIADLSSNTGGCLCLPFVTPKNAIRVPEITDFSSMGTIHINGFTPVQSANGGTGTVNLSIYVWAEEVELSIPTTSAVFTPQGAEQRTDGLISKPAAAIAAVASRLKDLPVIGPFALATEIGSGAIASIARIFGFSRPKQLEAPRHVRPANFSNLASTDCGEPVFSLALDSKQELSIDPRTVGLDGVDEMSIDYLTHRESYLTQFTWSPTDLSDKILFTTPVNPGIVTSEFIDATVGTFIQPTALAFATYPFNHWAGSVRFRFQIVCSQYHRGRLRIMWDPHNENIGVDGFTYDVSNVAFNKIIDISDQKDFTIDIGMGQDFTYLSTYIDRETANPFVANINAGQDNGLLAIQVLNGLTGPSDVGDVQLLVSIVAGDDFELRNPTVGAHYDSMTYFEPEGHLVFHPQGAAVDAKTAEDDAPIPSSDVLYMVPKKHSVDQYNNAVFFGEPIASFRTLMKRYQYSYVYGKTHVQTERKLLSYTTPNFPRYYGFDANANTTVNLVVFGPAGNTLFSYLTPAYVGWRGAIRWKFKPLCYTDDIATISVSRDPSTVSSLTRQNLLPEAAASGYGELAAWMSEYYASRTWAGMATTDVDVNTGLEIELPYQQRTRFTKARVMDLTSLSVDSDDSLSCPLHTVFVETKKLTASSFASVAAYVAAGDDFSLFFFVNAPGYYTYARPTPV